MRLIRSLAVTILGVVGGLMAGAAFAKRALPSRGDEQSDELSLVAIYDGIDLTSRAGAFVGGSVLAWFGGISLDLREATPAPELRLTVHALCGGVSIRVPAGWRVESGLRAIAGGVEVRVPEPESPDAPTLVLDGLALCGGIAVVTRAGEDASAA